MTTATLSDWRFRMGWDFRRLYGLTINDCPFLLYSDAADIWREGWRAGDEFSRTKEGFGDADRLL